MEANQKKKSNDVQQEESTNNKSRSESDIRDHKVSKPVEAGQEVSTGIAITSTTVPHEEKSTEEITKKKSKSVEDIQDQKISKSSKGSLAILTAATKTSIIIPSEEKKEKDTVNTSGTILYAEKKDNNKERGTEIIIRKRPQLYIKKTITKSKSGEDIPYDKKGKTWIWWGVLGGLLLVIGGVLKIVNTSKTQHVGGERQEKQTQRYRDAPVTH